MEIFKELGFTERETKVYIALLETGRTTVGPIANKTKIQHSKIYETIDKLINKGLVSFIVVSKTKYFQASNPKEILNIIEDKKSKFKEILGKLESKQKFSDSKQVAIVHEGYKSFKAMFNNLADELKKGDQYWVFAFKREYHNQDTQLFLRRFHQILEKKCVDDRAIGHESVKREIKHTFEDNNNINLKFTTNETPIGIIITKNKVINLLWGERPTAIEIISEQIFQQYKNFFEEIWKQAKK